MKKIQKKIVPPPPPPPPPVMHFRSSRAINDFQQCFFNNAFVPLYRISLSKPNYKCTDVDWFGNHLKTFRQGFLNDNFVNPFKDVWSRFYSENKSTLI